MVDEHEMNKEEWAQRIEVKKQTNKRVVSRANKYCNSWGMEKNVTPAYGVC